MRSWLLYILIVIAALAALLALAYSSPRATSGVFCIGTPVVVIGAGLGAKLLKETRKARRTHER